MSGVVGADALISAARDTAQQMVTACLHGDRDMAADLAIEAAHPEVLALVLADLTAYTHWRWMRALGGNSDRTAEGWQALMADIEEWRAETGK